MKLSIIIPVFNCAEFIRKCIKSIVEQGVDDYEIILIDDGSKDSSLEICRDFANSYNYIRVFFQENKGASSARNLGLDNAIGDYIWFVDADDYILPVLKQILTIISSGDFDLYLFDYERYSKGKATAVNISDKTLILNRVNLSLKGKPHYLWNRIYKRGTIGNLRFLDGTKNLEDFLFNVKFINKANSFLYNPIAIYRYSDENINSTSRSRSPRNLIKLSQDTLKVQEILFKEITDCCDSDYKVIINNMFNTSLIGHIYSLFSFYNYKRVRQVIKLYSEKGWYPIRYTSDNNKANIFIFVINNLFLLRVLSWAFYLKKIIQ